MTDQCAPAAKSPEWQERRRLVGWQVAEECKSISEFARRLGIQPQSAIKWLKNHDTDLHRALKDAVGHNVLTRDQRLERLRTYKAAIDAGLSHTKASMKCGVSQNRMRIWLRTWAPHGVEAAIADEQYDDDELEVIELEREVA